MLPSAPQPLPPAVMNMMDKTIKRLRHLPVHPDPIVPPSYLRPYGVITSAVRSDGQLVETALSSALQEVPHLKVIRTPSIFIPAEVDQYVSGAASRAALLASDLHYSDGVGRKVSPDAVIIDIERKAIDFLEVKRGLSKTDAGKTRQTVRDLQCLRLVGKSYARSMLGVQINETTAAVCAIHGASAVPPDLLVTLRELELRYRADLISIVERTYKEFGRRLDELLFEQTLDADMATLLGLAKA